MKLLFQILLTTNLHLVTQSIKVRNTNQKIEKSWLVIIIKIEANRSKLKYSSNKGMVHLRHLGKSLTKSDLTNKGYNSNYNR